ncbi:glycosidase [bacterium]|nr:MAG: glycosidase [bacterium]
MSYIYDLFQRHAGNPILTTHNWPYPAHTVFNAAATRLENGDTLLLARVEDRQGFSHLTKAVSRNGVDGWSVDSCPTFPPRPDLFPEEKWGVEDPRIVWIDELQEYVFTYTAFSGDGPVVAIARTKDFVNFERVGKVSLPDDKDAALFPRRINGKFAMIHRPLRGYTDSPKANMMISYSPDLKAWGETQMFLEARSGGWWDAGKIGLSTPPLETPEGWLIFYHGVRQNISGGLYRLGVSLHDLEDPTKVIHRGSEWIFGPHTYYEMAGDVGMVIFPCGFTVGKDGDTLNLYYGAADTSVALATGSIRQILEWLKEHDSGEDPNFKWMIRE